METVMLLLSLCDMNNRVQRGSVKFQRGQKNSVAN